MQLIENKQKEKDDKVRLIIVVSCMTFCLVVALYKWLILPEIYSYFESRKSKIQRIKQTDNAKTNEKSVIKTNSVKEVEKKDIEQEENIVKETNTLQVKTQVNAQNQRMLEKMAKEKKKEEEKLKKQREKEIEKLAEQHAKEMKKRKKELRKLEKQMKKEQKEKEETIEKNKNIELEENTNTQE